MTKGGKADGAKSHESTALRSAFGAPMFDARKEENKESQKVRERTEEEFGENKKSRERDGIQLLSSSLLANNWTCNPSRFPDLISSFFDNLRRRTMTTDESHKTVRPESSSSSYTVTVRLYFFLCLAPLFALFALHLIAQNEKFGAWAFISFTVELGDLVRENGVISQELLREKSGEGGGVGEERSKAVRMRSLRVSPMQQISTFCLMTQYTGSPEGKGGTKKRQNKGLRPARKGAACGVRGTKLPWQTI
ncbi:hypothetical protein BJV74DRAFT_797084 [Russula compacta]|nr:hypothetical protein BJV74DRAFT_797084 [Russula compacta]